MRPLNVTNLIPRPFSIKRREQEGVTLLEILIAMVLVGVLAALGLPQLLALLNGNKVTTGLDKIQGALQDAQRQAMRQSKPCTLEFKGGVTNGSVTTYKRLVINSDSGGCLVASSDKVESGTNRQMVELPQEVIMVTNIAGTTPEITFSFRGHTPGLTFDPPEDQATIIIVPYNENANTVYSGDKKCLVISSLLGMVRTGIYEKDASIAKNDIEATDCNTAIDGVDTN